MAAVLNTRGLLSLQLPQGDAMADRYDATVYYRKTIYAQARGAVLRYDAPGGYQVTQVDPASLHLAEIEASALLSYQRTGLDATYPLSYWGGKWRCLPEAPYGVGTTMNPLVPGRDFAQGHKQPIPFGSRLKLSQIPAELSESVRHVMYRADTFGPHNGIEPAENRIDLFVDHEIHFRGSVYGEIKYPWMQVSREGVRGAQESLSILGAELPRSRTRGGFDGLWGDETQVALDHWLAEQGARFLWGAPKYRHPNDPEIAYVLRAHAREEHAR